jgi:hypothetical protein
MLCSIAARVNIDFEQGDKNVGLRSRNLSLINVLTTVIPTASRHFKTKRFDT